MTEGPYKLPKGWRWVRLGEVAYRESKTIKPAEEPSKIFRYLGMEHLDAGQWEEPIYVELEGAMIKSQAIIFYPGMVLYGKLRPYLNKVVIPTVEGVASTEFVPLLTNNNFLIPEYLGAYLRSPFFVSYASRNTSGSRQPRVQFGAFWDALIPLPPISEQKRIVERINDLFSRIREAKRLRQEAQQEAERLWQSVLADTFPKPGTKLPNGWQWVKLEDIAQVFSGSSAPQDEDYFTEGKYPFVRVSDLSSSVDGYITKTRDAVNDKAIKELKLIKAAAGTIVFPKSGAAILTNARAILAIDAYIVSHLAALSPDRSKADKDWLYYYLSTVDMGQYSDNPSYPSLKLSRIKNIEIPLPNLIKQREIVAYLKCIHEKVQSMKEAQAQTEAELQRLEQAILDKAFLGEL